MLEQLFNLKGIKGYSLNIILIGVIYAFIGIFSSLLLFPNYVSTMSLAFISITLIPTLGYLLQKEENIVAKERHFSPVVLLRDHKDIIRLYLLIFFGIFLAFTAVGIFTPSGYINHNFNAQLKVAGISGEAIGLGGEILGILLNNLLVLGICFILSLAYGSGSVIFLVWNASVWGIVFGYFIRQAAVISEINPFIYFFKIFLPFLPHMITEAASYIVAAIMGGIIAKAIIREKLFSEKFYHILADGIMMAVLGFLLVVVAGIIEVLLFPLFL
jgi:hypothetical protein